MHRDDNRRNVVACFTKPHQKATELHDQSKQQNDRPDHEAPENHLLQEIQLVAPELRQLVVITLIDTHPEMASVWPGEPCADQLREGGRHITKSDEEVDKPERNTPPVCRVIEERHCNGERQNAYADHVGAMRNLAQAIAADVLQVE